jgi:2-polyprenyl-3-methyl-5-hydroxy-6-metoxy-1,4-benzoquinol methylase
MRIPSFSTKTAERVSDTTVTDKFIFTRSLFAYDVIKQHIHGTTLEIGCGEQYGVRLLAHKAKEYYCLDKFEKEISGEDYPWVIFQRQEVPPLNFESNKFDVVICFQVLEHIKDDKTLISEIFRVLKPGGILFLSTPNKSMSLTRNPWHIREYSQQGLAKLLSHSFKYFYIYGINGNEKTNQYFQLNKKYVEKIMKFDILDLQHRLPGWILRIPYDILNRINRKLLYKSQKERCQSFSVSDYFLTDFTTDCYDYLTIARRPLEMEPEIHVLNTKQYEIHDDKVA